MLVGKSKHLRVPQDVVVCQGVHDHLLDSAYASDRGHERPDDRDPNNQPAPVEQNPPVHPGRVGILAVVWPPIFLGFSVEGIPVEVIQVVTAPQNNHVDQGSSRASKHHHHVAAYADAERRS